MVLHTPYSLSAATAVAMENLFFVVVVAEMQLGPEAESVCQTT